LPKKIELTLPEPPSANRYWRHARGRTYRSAEANAYRESVAVSCRMRLAFPEGAVKVTATWFRSRRSGDLDNRWKVLGDALNGILWADDQQITELHLYRKDAPKHGRIELIVEAA
jgi:crossover junction endodeoxyribonuclease RusA